MSLSLNDYLHDALDRVTHTSSVDAFYHQFQALKTLVSSTQPLLPEEYFASRFVYGLQEAFQSFLIRFHPTTVMAAYRLALIFEESIYIDYFPEMELPSDDVCEGLLGEDLSSKSSIIVESTKSNQGKRGSIDIIVVDSAILQQSLDSPDSIDVMASRQRDNVSPIGFHPSIPSGEATNRPSLVGSDQQRVVRDVITNEDVGRQSQGFDGGHNNALELLVVKELKVHPPDVAISLVESSWSFGISVMLFHSLEEHQQSTTSLNGMVDPVLCRLQQELVYLKISFPWMQLYPYNG